MFKSAVSPVKIQKIYQIVRTALAPVFHCSTPETDSHLSRHKRPYDQSEQNGRCAGDHLR